MRQIVQESMGEYDVKIIKSGNNLKIYNYHEKMNFNYIPNENRKFEVVKYDNGGADICNNVTGEIVSPGEFKNLYEMGKINGIAYFTVIKKYERWKMTANVRRLNDKKENLRKTRERLMGLVNANIVGQKEQPKFWTITFKENIIDVKRANEEFKKFVKKWNRELKKQGMDENIQYLTVLENQERGAIHYHMITFNMPFQDAKMVEKKYWKLGSVRVNSLLHKGVKKQVEFKNGRYIVDGEVLENVGAYITKALNYMTKTVEELTEVVGVLEEIPPKYLVLFEKGVKFYQCSQNLKKPKVYKCLSTPQYLKILNHIKKEYTKRIETQIESLICGSDVMEFRYNENDKIINSLLENLEVMEDQYYEFEWEQIDDENGELLKRNKWREEIKEKFNNSGGLFEFLVK